QLDFVTRLHLIAGYIDLAAIHLDVPVPDDLTRLFAGGCETHPIDDVVQAALETNQQVLTCNTRLPRGLLEEITERTLGNAVNPLHLLLFVELMRVLRSLAAAR